jgi:hypothetical protein
MTEKPNAITLNILAKRDGDLWVGHCLELDIVGVADTLEALKADLNDLITAQIDYAFSNDNLTHLFRAAPAEVWAEFYRCRRIAEDQIEIAKGDNASSFVPPWIIANTCLSENSCVA